MKISIISFTKRGRQLSLRLKSFLCADMDIALYYKSETVSEEDGEVKRCEESLAAWTKRQFCNKRAVLYIGACGIAVRAIAPCIKDKLSDIPVLVMDETGTYMIPVLSGHYGGANELAVMIAKRMGAEAVITTATDLNYRFAADVFARKNNLIICSKEGIKKVSSAILREEKVTIAVDGRIRGSLPHELEYVEIKENKEVSILVAPILPEKLKPILWLCPKVFILGIGCRRGKALHEIEAEVKKQLKILKIPMEAVAAISSVEEKKKEKGICDFAEQYELPFLTFSSNELKRLTGTYTASEFVKRQMGVDNVCERAAMAAAGEDARLILKKQADNGITVAAAIKKWSVNFE